MVASMWPNAFHRAHSTRSRWMSMFASLSGLLAADHGEEAAFAAAAQQHPELDDEPVNGGTSRTRCEELLVGCEALGGDASRKARHELDAGLVKPSQHLVERVLVLVHEPCLPAGAVERHTAQPGVEERQAIARQAEDEAAGVGGEPAVGVVQADDDEAAGPETCQDGPEAGVRVTGVVKDPV